MSAHRTAPRPRPRAFLGWSALAGLHIAIVAGWTVFAGRAAAAAAVAGRTASVASGAAVLILGALVLAPSAEATFSIVARDPETGQIGAAVQSHWFQVSRVISVEPGVGAVASQSLADFAYGPAALELLSLGRSAEKTLEGLLASDTAPQYRQVAVLDADGGVAVHTGESCIAGAGHVKGEHYSVQANLMELDTVPEAMAKAFLGTEGDLAERMMAALEAAQAERGDIRGQQSAAMIVVSPESSGREWEDRIFDLRVDDHPEAVAEMRRVLTVARAYRSMNEGDLAIERADFEAAERAYGLAVELAPGNPEPRFWYAVSLVNADRVDAAVRELAAIYAEYPIWRELPERLRAVGLLPDEDELIRRLTEAD